MTLFHRLYQRGGASYRRLRDKAISALALFRRRLFDWIDERSVMWLHKAGTSDSMKQRTLRRLKRGRVRSLWGCTPILTLPMKSRADRLLGFVSHSLVFTTYGIFRNFADKGFAGKHFKQLTDAMGLRLLRPDRKD